MCVCLCSCSGAPGAQMPKKKKSLNKSIRYVVQNCCRLINRFDGRQVSDEVKCDLIQSHLSKELLLLHTLDEQYHKWYTTNKKQLQVKFLEEVVAAEWFRSAQAWGFTSQHAREAFSRQTREQGLVPNSEFAPGSSCKGLSSSTVPAHTCAAQSGSRKFKEEKAGKHRQKTNGGETTQDLVIAARRANNRRNTGLIAKEWRNFIAALVKDSPEKQRRGGAVLDLSKAPTRGSHWLFKIFQAFQQVLESVKGANRAGSEKRRHSGVQYQDSPGKWEYLNGAFGLPEERAGHSAPAPETPRIDEESNLLPFSFVKWNKAVLEFFSQPSATLTKEMPRIIHQLRESVFVSHIQRAAAGSIGKKVEDLREHVAQLLQTPSWPPLWLTCWVGHLILLAEDSQWKREPRRLVVELNEKDTYFFYEGGGWQNHWAEERDGLAAAGKGILCCAWNSDASFLSIFAPSPALWSCRLTMVYLLKRGRNFFGGRPRHRDLYLASKSDPLERGSLGTCGHASELTPLLASKQAHGRMGLLHDLHSSIFWKQALSLLFLYFLEKHSLREATSPGSKASSLILPCWFAELTSSFLIYFNEALSSDPRPAEFNSLSASVIMSTKALPMILLSLAVPMLSIKKLHASVSWKKVRKAHTLEQLCSKTKTSSSLEAAGGLEEEILFLGQERPAKWFAGSRTLLVQHSSSILSLSLDVSLLKPIFVIAHCREHATFLHQFLGKHLAFALENKVQSLGSESRVRSAEPNLLCRLNLAEDLGVGRSTTPEENRFDEIDLFAHKSQDLEDGCWIYTMPLEDLSHALDPTQTTFQNEPGLLLFWGVNSLVNIELNSPDIWKQKRLAYHNFEKLGRDDIPRVMILEPYYIDRTKELKQQTYRKIIRSCCVSRFMLHFVVHSEALKCQKIRGTAAGKGSTCFSKSFLDCKSNKKGKEDVWKRTQDKVVAKTFSRPLRLRDVVRSPGNDLGNVCFIVYEELSPLCHDNMQAFWSKLNSDRDRKVFLTLCFGEPLSVVWSTRYKAHQVYKLCSTGMGEEDEETHIKTFKPNETEVARLLDRSDWIINSGMRIALSCVIHQALLKGVCIMNVEERHSCQTIPPLITYCLKRLKQHLDQQRMVTLVDLPALWSQIYEQNSLWTPMSNSNVHNFQGYMESIDKCRQALDCPSLDPRNLHYRPPGPDDQQQTTNFSVRLTCHLHMKSRSQEKIVSLSGQTSIEVKLALEKAGCLDTKAKENSSCVIALQHLLPGVWATKTEDFLAPAFERICRCLSTWNPGSVELSCLFRAFCEADLSRLLPETSRLCRLLFEKTNLQQLCCLLNWCWLLDFGVLFQLLCMALSVGQTSPLYSNLNSYQETMCRGGLPSGSAPPNSPSISPDKTVSSISRDGSQAKPPTSSPASSNPLEALTSGKASTPLIQAEDNIRTTIDDSSLFFAQKKALYQLLGKRLWQHGLLLSDFYTNKGTPEFWSDPDLAFCSFDSKVHVTVQCTNEVQSSTKRHESRISFTKRGSLNLIDTVLASQGHRKPLTRKNNTFIWVVESNLLPNGTRLSTTTVSVPLPLSSIIHNKIPLDRFTGPVFIPLPSRFSKKVNIHKNFYWDKEEALKERMDVGTYSKLLASKLSLQLDPMHLQNVPPSIQKSVAFYPPLLFPPFRNVSVRKRFSDLSKRKENRRIKKEQQKIHSRRGRKKKQAPEDPSQLSHTLFNSPVIDTFEKPSKKQKLVGGNSEGLPALPGILGSPLNHSAINAHEEESTGKGQVPSILRRAFDPTEQTGSGLSPLHTFENSTLYNDQQVFAGAYKPDDHPTPGVSGLTLVSPDFYKLNTYSSNEHQSLENSSSIKNSTAIFPTDSNGSFNKDLENHASSFDAFANMMNKLNYKS